MKPGWLQIAERELNVAEIKGDKNNPRIIDYHSVTSLKATDDETPWCSAFACWAMEASGFLSPKSARARDWLNWGVSIGKPIEGCVVILTRGKGDSGHVGFYVGETDLSIELLGGNQGDKVSIQKFSKERVLGYRMPEDYPIFKPWHPPLILQS